MASGGYPTAYKKGFPIEMPEEIADHVVVAGASLEDGRLVTSGGRVLGVCATGETLTEALATAYARTERIGFEGAFYRHDIGKRALAAGKE